MARRIIQSALLAASVLAAACARPQQAGPNPPAMAMRRLVIMTDGVPWTVMDSLHRAGHFEAFRSPSKLISPFPSLTGVAFRDIWQEPLSPGYEDKYYDSSENRIAGGLLDHVFRSSEHAGFHRHVEAEGSSLTTGLAYLTPVPMSKLELNAIARRIRERAAYDTTVVAYVVTTDAIAHRAARKDLVGELLRIEALLHELRAANPSLEITMFSDHGNDFVPTQRVPLDQAVRAAGFHEAKSLRNPEDVVLPRFGLVGSAFLFAMPHAETRLAESIRKVDGVDLVMFEDDNGTIHVMNHAADATIESDAAGSWYRYTPLHGDPLGLAPALAEMRAQGLADATGAAPDSVWLRYSMRTPYIDAMRRIVVGMRAAVRNRASVIASFAPGYHFGDAAADRLVRVTGTHGSLRTTSSTAYLMTTGGDLPPILRSDAVLPYLGAGL